MKNIRYLFFCLFDKNSSECTMSVYWRLCFCTHISISLIMFFSSLVFAFRWLTVGCWLLTADIVQYAVFHFDNILNRQEKKATFTFGKILNYNFVGRVVYECAELLPTVELCTKISSMHNSPVQWNRIIMKKNPTPWTISQSVSYEIGNSECRTYRVDFLFVLFHYDCRRCTDITFPIRCSSQSFFSVRAFDCQLNKLS